MRLTTRNFFTEGCLHDRATVTQVLFINARKVDFSVLKHSADFVKREERKYTLFAG
jgi:hypothetical protein